MDQEVIQQGSGCYTTRIRRLYNKDQEVIQQETQFVRKLKTESVTKLKNSNCEKN